MFGLSKELFFPITASGVGLVLLTWWLTTATEGNIDRRMPGQDAVPVTAVGSMSDTPIVSAGEPIRGDGEPSQISGTWPGFRGFGRTGVVTRGVALAREWPETGPPALWTLPLGEGYASAAVSGGCAYVLDYDEAAAADTLRCLSLDDGREVWRNSYPVDVTRNHGMSRTVPAIAEGLVITIGPRCHVASWDATTGECRWLIDLVRDHGATEPRWYAGQCPLIDDGNLILASCGDTMLMSVNCRTGEILWESPNPRGWEMTHASVVPMEFAGQRGYVYCGSGGVAAVSTDGRLLWDSTDWPTTFATCPSPLVLPEGRIFLCSGYGRTIGSLILQVHESNGTLAAETAITLTPQQFNSEQHTPLLYKDRIYGVRKRGGGQLVCLDLDGNERWNSGRDRFGHGPYMIADDMIFVMDNDGWLTMAEATPEAYHRLGRFEVFQDGHDAWGPMTLVNGRLIVRDMTRMTCLDLASSEATASNVSSDTSVTSTQQRWIPDRAL